MLLVKRIGKIIALSVVLLVILLAYLIRGSYRVNQLLHSMIQRNEGFVGKILNVVVSSPIRFIFQQHLRYTESRDRDTISPIAILQYGQDDDLSGYGTEDFAKGGDQISEQQRGMILPTLRDKLKELPSNAVAVEIGTGNGDVAALIATEFPEIKIVGIDFSVAMATKKHSEILNLKFQKGYALKLIESGKVQGDIVWTSSTFAIVTPLEFHRYLAAISKSFSHIVMSEPTWGGHAMEMDGLPISEHLEDAIWFHNYVCYVKHYGYSIDRMHHSPYKHPVSLRPDVRLLIASCSN